jgi:hypothetical protein
MTRRRRLAAAALLPLLLAGCTSSARTSAGASPSTSAGGGRLHCPAPRAAPDPHRPAVTLDFRLADDLRTVTGSEDVRFTPDRATAELVFRLVPNGPGSSAAGNRLTVESVRGTDVAGGAYEADAGAAPGGLYRVRLTHPLAAGNPVRVTLAFTLDLGRGAFDRLGTAPGLSWWASGAPLLAWEPGVGWVRDPFVRVLGETATSPAMDTVIRVSAPAALTVLMTGAQEPPSAARDGRRTWTATEPAARDVSVAVGRFTTREGRTSDGVRVTVGVPVTGAGPPGAALDTGRLLGWTTAAIAGLERYLGPFPYRTLTVPYLGEYGGGIEYPSSIQLAIADRPVLVHEVAHMWFYGMVGDDQYRDPWLDEAFASYAEGLIDPPPPGGLQRVLKEKGRVGASIGDFADTGDYFRIVYGKGEAALLTARSQAGAAAFDAAVRCYVNANAWRIATPADVGAALAGLPAAVRVLLTAGALREADVPR